MTDISANEKKTQYFMFVHSDFDDFYDSCFRLNEEISLILPYFSFLADMSQITLQRVGQVAQ